MRLNTGLHHFESVFYIGIPLVLFTLILLGLRRWSRRLLPSVMAVVALPVFALSAYQMQQTDAQIRVPALATNAAVMSDLLEIRRIAEGQRVYVQVHELDPYVRDVYHIIDYYLAGSIIQLEERPISGCGPLCGQYFDFVISGDRNLYPDNLLTPSNREVFLFDTGGIDTDGLTAGYRAVYDAITSGGYGAPMVRAEYDLFIADGKAVYYKSRCRGRIRRTSSFCIRYRRIEMICRRSAGNTVLITWTSILCGAARWLTGIVLRWRRCRITRLPVSAPGSMCSGRGGKFGALRFRLRVRWSMMPRCPR